MKTVIRMFFRALRVVLGPVMLLKERLTRPKGLLRSPESQARVDEACRELALYQYKTCPFCIKVRQEMRRLSLSIEGLDAQHDATHREALVSGGGRAKVPCLKVTEAGGESRWVYESGEIIAFLRQRFAA